MVPSSPGSRTQEITAVLSSVESGSESESFRATYDTACESTSLAVVAAVTAARGDDPLTLTPLQTVVDTDALDELTTEGAPSRGAHECISFRYDGFEVTVTGEGVIEAKRVGNGEPASTHPYRIECTSCGTARTGRRRPPDTAVVPYRDECSECGCEDFDVGVSTGDE